MITPTTLSGLARGLEKVRWNGDYKFTACCPAHDDRNPSFSATDVGGKILVKCFAGCSQEEVIGAFRDLGLWHTASPTQLNNRRKRGLEKAIRHHRTILALGLNLKSQGIELSDIDQHQVKESIEFLQEHVSG